MAAHLTELYRTALSRYEAEVVHERVRSRVTDTLAQHGISLPAGATLAINDGERIVSLVGGKKKASPELTALLESVAENALHSLLLEDTEAHAAPAVTAAGKKNAEAVPVEEPWYESYARYAFWAVNLFFVLFVGIWLVRFATSSDFREWYTTELFSTGGTLFVYTFLVCYLAIPLATFLSRRRIVETLAHPYTRLLLYFELPVLLVTLVVQSVIFEVSMTETVRTTMLFAWVATLITWTSGALCMSIKHPAGRFIELLLSVLTNTVLYYLALLILVPLYLFALVELVPHLFEELFHNLDPFLVLYALFYGVLLAVPIVIVYIVIRRSYQHTKSLLAGLSLSSLQQQAVLVLVPGLFLAVLMIGSQPVSLGEYEEPLLLLAEEDGGYAAQASRMAALAEEKEEVDERLIEVYSVRDQFPFTMDELWDKSDDDVEGYVMKYLAVVAYPFVYRGDETPSRYRVDESPIGRGYERAYGTSLRELLRGEQVPVRNVQHKSRDIQVLTQDETPLVEVTVTDSYSTFVQRDQEVVLEFSLPEHAVITDLRLGPSLEFSGQIAPRGAAEEVYVREVRQRIDPALLEQVGPRQYRLRAYPVPGVSQFAERTRREEVSGPTQRVQFSYVVARTSNGIPLPQFSAEHNLLTNEREVTVRIDGQEADLGENGAYVSNPVNLADVCANPRRLSAPLSDGQFAELDLGGESCTDVTEELSRLRGQRFVLFIDTAYENTDAFIGDRLEELRSFPPSFFTENDVSYRTFTNGTLSKPVAIESPDEVPAREDLTFFGAHDLDAALRAVTPDTHTAIILTGEEAEFSASQQQLPDVRGVSLVFVHPPGKLPPFPTNYYAYLGSAWSVATDDSMPRAVMKAARKEALYNGAYWSLTVTATTTAQLLEPSERNELMLVGERLSVATELASTVRTSPLRAARGADTGVLTGETLQKPYERAAALGIVTPISSYIALVNDRQQQLLRQLSLEDDRFSSSQNFSVTQPRSLGNPLGSRGPEFGFGGTMGFSPQESGSPMPLAGSGGGGLMSGDGGQNPPSGSMNILAVAGGAVVLFILLGVFTLVMRWRRH